MRLFIAIEVGDELKNALVLLRRDLTGVRWVSPEQLHLTLAFLGEVEEGRVGALCAELARIDLPPFPLTLTGISSFPDRQNPRLLMIGLAPDGRLMQLVAAVQAALLSSGLPPAPRPFFPHLTLGRCPGPGAGAVFASLLASSSPRLFPVLAVDAFTLFASSLQAHAAEHLPLQRFLLPASSCGHLSRRSGC